MSDDQDNCDRDRAPSRRHLWWVALVACALLGFGAFRTWWTEGKSDLVRAIESGVSVKAMANHFYLIDREWRPFEEQHAFVADLVLFKSPLGPKLELTPRLLRVLCGELMSAMSEMADVPVEQRNVFRIILLFPTFEDGKATGRYHGNRSYRIPVKDATCPTEQEILDMRFGVFPGVMSDWGLLGLNEFTSNRENSPGLIATFASRTGRIIPPLPFLDGCRAALVDYSEFIEMESEHPNGFAVAFLGSMAKDVTALAGEAGLAQHFTVSDGNCEEASEIYQFP